jgi:hypothetical protein
MRFHRRLLRSAGGFCMRPSVWGTVLVLTAVVVGSLTFARLVVTPAIFGSDRFVPSAPRKSELKRANPISEKQKKSEVTGKTYAEPPVQISLAAAETRKHRRRRVRRHLPDVVYRAPANAPGFAHPLGEVDPPDPPPTNVDPDDSESDRQQRDDHS